MFAYADARDFLSFLYMWFNKGGGSVFFFFLGFGWVGGGGVYKLRQQKISKKRILVLSVLVSL